MPANTGNTINQNLIPTDPQLIDLLNMIKKDVLLNLSAHHVGTIESFNLSQQTASASINYKKTYFEFSGINNTYAPVLVNYPILAECPVIFLGGGSGSLTFPLKKGDECLILFNDRDIDNWFTGGSGSSNATARLHSFSDGIILVGLRSLANSLKNYDAIRSVLRGGMGVVAANTQNSKVLITNVAPSGSDGNLSYSTTLKTLLQDLIGNIKDLVTAVNAITVTTPIVVPTTPFTGTATSQTPNNSTQISNVSSELTTTATNLGALLE